MNNNTHAKSVIIPAAGKRPGEHVWVPGSDVQSLWKKFGWTPPSETRPGLKRTGSPPANDAHRPLRIVRG